MDLFSVTVINCYVRSVAMRLLMFGGVCAAVHDDAVAARLLDEEEVVEVKRGATRVLCMLGQSAAPVSLRLCTRR